MVLSTQTVLYTPNCTEYSKLTPSLLQLVLSAQMVLCTSNGSEYSHGSEYSNDTEYSQMVLSTPISILSTYMVLSTLMVLSTSNRTHPHIRVDQHKVSLRYWHLHNPDPCLLPVHQYSFASFSGVHLHRLSHKNPRHTMKCRRVQLKKSLGYTS